MFPVMIVLSCFRKNINKMAVDIPEETIDNYIRSEFKAMDSDQDGKLNRQQVLDLLILLGYSKGKDKLKVERRKYSIPTDWPEQTM